MRNRNKNTVKIIASSTPNLLDEALRLAETASVATATVEAEYGDVLVPGSWATLAHHGPRAHLPCPCILPNRQDAPDTLLVGISHLDLDTLGGVLSLLGTKPEAEDFWELAAKVDVQGPHMVPIITRDQNLVSKLNAFWAWSDAHRLSLPPGQIVDATANIEEARLALLAILEGDNALLEAGKVWASRKAELAASTLRGVRGPVAFRVSEVFVNHLYTPEQTAIVGYNPTKGIITASFVDEVTHGDANVANILKAYFGPEAGGRKTVGGGPRDLFITEQEAEKFWAYMAQQVMGN